MRCVFAVVLLVAVASARRSELWTKEQEKAAGFVGSYVTSPTPQEYVSTASLPTGFTWGDVNGTNYLTKNLNQHIPQYCGSCWAHAAVSSLGDRIKIARKGKGIDVNLAVQHILNCGSAGSCHGGSIGGAFEWIKRNKDGIVYDTCNPYMACSSESKEGFCKEASWKCTAENVCRTCSTFTESGGKCAALNRFPNATVAEFGTVRGEEAMMKEIYARGPIGCGVDATKITNYQGGIAKGFCLMADHAISVVGWGEDQGEKYWIVRNSWGEYWGEMGYFRVSRGSGMDLCVEQTCNWATPGSWTEVNYPCDEDGHNCQATKTYVDPAHHRRPLGDMLRK